MTGSGRWHYLIEPPRLIEHFVARPPVGFRTWWSPAGTPMFSAGLDPFVASGARVRRLASTLARWTGGGDALQLKTCFVGTAVSEHIPLARGSLPSACVDDVLNGPARDDLRCHTLVVVKDLPCDSPLVDATENAHADAVCNVLRDAGFVLLSGQALAWVAVDFSSIDEYLARLSRNRRKDIRRKLRSREVLRISMEPTGAPIFGDPGVREGIYRLYRNVYDHGRAKFERLTPAFLDAILQDPAVDGRVFLYATPERMIGFNLCFVAGDTLVDKYVGFAYPQAREHNLYCVSWFQNLDYALAAGLTRYVAGASDPQFKADLGARFTMTRHAVYASNRVLRVALRGLSRGFERDREWIEGKRRAPDRA